MEALGNPAIRIVYRPDRQIFERILLLISVQHRIISIFLGSRCPLLYNLVYCSVLYIRAGLSGARVDIRIAFPSQSETADTRTLEVAMASIGFSLEAGFSRC